MRKFFIVAALIIFGLASPASAQAPQSSIYYEYYDDGKVKLAIPLVGDILQGDGKMYYPDGTVQAKVYFENNEVKKVAAYYEPDGKLANGRVRFLDQSGKLLFQGTAINGVPEGEATHYNPDGTVQFKLIYKEGEVIQKILPEVQVVVPTKK